MKEVPKNCRSKLAAYNQGVQKISRQIVYYRIPYVAEQVDTYRTQVEVDTEDSKYLCNIIHITNANTLENPIYEV